MCGADYLAERQALTASGSPPRVRSRLIVAPVLRAVAGITSACAEQTAASSSRACWAWDHLRVCGADQNRKPRGLRAWGSPPRVRSRLSRTIRRPRWRRITSACAEQTPIAPIGCARSRDHLRVCGADRDGSYWVDARDGSPPRVRSRLRPVQLSRLRGGITSACAEQTA